MESIEERSKYIVAGDLRLEVSCGSDGVPDRVTVYECQGEPVALFSDVAAETIERVAKALKLTRVEAGDKRSVCTDHGYYSKRDCDACCVALGIRP